MQNKIIIPTIIACAIILTGVVALAQYNSNKVVSNLNSSSSSAVSSNVSSSSSIAMSSVVASSVADGSSSSQSSTINSSSLESSSSKTQEPKKSTENNPMGCNTIKTDYKFNQDFSFKLDNKCIPIAYWVGEGGLFKESKIDPYGAFNYNKLFLTEQNINLANQIGADYYSRVKDKIISDSFKIRIDSNGKISDKEFSIIVILEDPDYAKIDPEAQGPWYVGRLKAFYKLYENSNGDWTLQFQNITPNIYD
jgi:hypothetical protein